MMDMTQYTTQSLRHFDYLICSRCKKEKQANSFYKKSTGRGRGRWASECIKCTSVVNGIAKDIDKKIYHTLAEYVGVKLMDRYYHVMFYDDMFNEYGAIIKAKKTLVITRDFFTHGLFQHVEICQLGEIEYNEITRMEQTVPMLEINERTSLAEIKNALRDLSEVCYRFYVKKS